MDNKHTELLKQFGIVLNEDEEISDELIHEFFGNNEGEGND